MTNKTTPKIPGRPGRPAVKVGDQLSRTQIAHRAGIDRGTISKYLDMRGAPKPDARGRFSYRAVKRWIDSKAPRAGGGDGIRILREKMLALELARMERQDARERGELIAVASIEPDIVKFMAQLTQDLQDRFERLLPARYVGKTYAECLKLNEDSVDWVIRRLKNGTKSMTEKAPIE